MWATHVCAHRSRFLGADVNRADQHGRTPLDEVYRLELCGTADALLRLGAQPAFMMQPRMPAWRKKDSISCTAQMSEQRKLDSPQGSSTLIVPGRSCAWPYQKSPSWMWPPTAMPISWKSVTLDAKVLHFFAYKLVD